MSKQLSSVAVTEFDSMVKHAYQGMGLLKGSVTVRNNVVGDTYKFRRQGKGLANQKSTSDLVTPMDVSHEFKTGALGRRCDQLVIDAMDASTPLTTTVPAGAANLTMAKVIQAQVELRDQGVPNTDLFAVIEAEGLGGLLNDELATSTDYQNIKALVSGEINTLVGFRFIIIETRVEGGLNLAGNIVDSWFYQRPAVGLAVGIDMKTEINWIAERTSWLSNGMLKAGSVVRDEGGLVKVQYDKTA